MKNDLEKIIQLTHRLSRQHKFIQSRTIAVKTFGVRYYVIMITVIIIVQRSMHYVCQTLNPRRPQKIQRVNIYCCRYSAISPARRGGEDSGAAGCRRLERI